MAPENGAGVAGLPGTARAVVSPAATDAFRLIAGRDKPFSRRETFECGPCAVFPPIGRLDAHKPTVPYLDRQTWDSENYCELRSLGQRRFRFETKPAYTQIENVDAYQFFSTVAGLRCGHSPALVQRKSPAGCRPRLMPGLEPGAEAIDDLRQDVWTEMDAVIHGNLACSHRPHRHATGRRAQLAVWLHRGLAAGRRLKFNAPQESDTAPALTKQSPRTGLGISGITGARR
jgi:hypothetical protein